MKGFLLRNKCKGSSGYNESMRHSRLSDVRYLCLESELTWEHGNGVWGQGKDGAVYLIVRLGLVAVFIHAKGLTECCLLDKLMVEFCSTRGKI